MTDKTRESAPPLVKQVWEFLEEQLELAEKKEMEMGRFVTAPNEAGNGVRAGNLEYASQPPTGLVLGIPQVPVQHGPGIYV